MLEFYILEFIGDYKKLIPMGYKFQKLFAMNYISYRKGEYRNEIFIWRKGKDVSYQGGSHVAGQIYKYLLDRQFNCGDGETFFDFNKETYELTEQEILDDGVSYDADNKIHFDKEKMEIYKQKLDFRSEFIHTKHINEINIKVFKELHDNNLVKLTLISQ